MRFFTKLFLCTVFVLTAALAAAEYFTVSASLNNAVEHQVESGLQQHQLVKYAIQSGVLNASRTGSVDERALTDIAGQAADAMSVNLSLAQSGESALYSNLADGLSAAAGTDGGIGYQILERTAGSGVHSDWLVMTSTFQQSGYALELTTARSMSAVFTEAELLRQRSYGVSLALMAVKPEISLVSCQIRYEEIRVAGTTPRATDPAHHNKIIDQIVSNLGVLEASGMFDEIALYDRSQTRLFPREGAGDSAEKALRTILFDPWTPEERRHYNELKAKLNYLKTK